MKIFIHILLVSCCFASVVQPDTPENSIIEIASLYVGHTEKQKNRSELIDYWNGRLNVPPGSNYCATFIAFVLDSAGVKIPDVRSGVAQHYITRQSITSQKVLSGKEIPPGSIVIWKRGESWQGHTEFVREKWVGASGKTIGANTTPPQSNGDQRQGNGVWERDRRIDITAFFRITHFTLTD
jgi:hypothetical protein